MNSVRLRKEGAVSIQRKKPWRIITTNYSSDLPFLCYDQTRIAEASNTGKSSRVPIGLARVPRPFLAVGVSQDSCVVVGLLSTNNLFVWMKNDPNMKLVNLPPLLKALYQDAKAAIHFSHGQSLAVNNSGTAVVLSTPNDQVWLWRANSAKLTAKSVLKWQGTWRLLKPGASDVVLAAFDEVGTPSISSSYITSQSSSSEPFRQVSHARAIDYAFSSSPEDGKFICILRVWLTPMNEASISLDFDYLQTTLELAERGGLKTNREGIVTQTRSRGTIEFKSREDPELVLALDHSGYLAAVAVNSSYLFMCKLVFLAPKEHRGTCRRLAQYFTKDDMPPCNEDGHTDMWVTALAWTPDDNYLVLALRSSCISIFTRLGEPVHSQIEITSSVAEPRIFSHIFFSTEPSRFGKHPRRLGCTFRSSKLLVWDGFTVINFEVEGFQSLRELAPSCLPHEQDLDLTISISHDTNPLPSEMDMGPKRHPIEKALQLLRTSINLRKNKHEGVVFEAATAWLEGVLPPALHEEISYTVNLSQVDLNESRINSNLVLKKKVRSYEVLMQFDQVLEILSWRALPAVEYKEWTLVIAKHVVKYLLADGQALYAYNAITKAEKALGLKLHKLRMMIGVHSLLQYKNFQANQLNVIFYALAFVTLHGWPKSPHPQINSRECNFLRLALRDALEIAPPDSEPEELPQKDCYDITTAPKIHFLGPIRSNIESSFAYLMGRPFVFESYGEKLCHMLISDDPSVGSLISKESLFLVAFYLDPMVEFFLSPVEFVSLELKSCAMIQEVYSRLVQLSNVPVAKSREFSKEAAFLYWAIGLTERVSELLDPQLAYAALVSALYGTVQTEARVICWYLRDLQPKLPPLMAFEVAPEYLKAFFQVQELRRMKEKLKSSIDDPSAVLSRKGKGSSEFPALPHEYPQTLHEWMALAARALKGTYLGTKKLTTKNWIYLETPTTDELKGVHSALIKEAQGTLRYLWYFYIIDQLARQRRQLPWLLRLLEFSEVRNKVTLYSQVLNSLGELETSDLELLAVYFLESELPRRLDSRLSRCKAAMSQQVPGLYPTALQAIKQKQSFSVDFGFLDFCESVYRAFKPKREWAAVKQWREVDDKYRAVYKVVSRLMFVDGSFRPLETEDCDFTFLFRECKVTDDSRPLEDLAEASKEVSEAGEFCKTLVCTVKHPSTIRSSSPLRSFGTNSAPSISARLSCSSLLAVLSAVLKRAVSRVFVKRNPLALSKPSHRRQMSSPVQSSPYQIVSVKPLKVGNESIKLRKPLGVEFTSIRGLHRRTKSAAELIERPFQLLRIKSKAC